MPTYRKSHNGGDGVRPGAELPAFRWTRRHAIATTLAFPAAACAQGLPVVRVGCGNVEATPQAYFAADAGFFSRTGLDVRLNVMRGGATQIAATVAGDLDVAEASTVAFGAAITRGVALMAIAPGILWDDHYPTAGLVVAPQSPLRSGADLDGKTVGVTVLAALGVLGVQAYMDATGGDHSTVKFVEIPATALAGAVATGRVDAAVIEEPALGDAIAAGAVRLVAPALGGIASQFYENVWFSRADWLKRNMDTARRFRSAIVRAGAWAESNRAASEKIMEKYTKARVAGITERYGQSLDPALVQSAWNAAYKYKLYPTLPQAAQYCWDGK